MKNNPKIIKIDFKKLRLNLEIQKKKKNGKFHLQIIFSFYSTLIHLAKIMLNDSKVIGFAR